MEPSSVSLTTGVFNLASAIFNITNPTGVAAAYSVQLIKWLSRQGIDETRFEECALLARGRAYPNMNGLGAQQSVEEAERQLRNLRNPPISLIFSTSLGRLMAKEPEYCWMVSTVGCLAEYHTLSIIKSLLTDILFDNEQEEVEVKYRYHAQRLPIKLVIDKIVDSIFLNVINGGHNTHQLPEELRMLNAHIMESHALAAMIMRIHRSQSDLLIRCKLFPTDLTSWLFNHFEGQLDVYVDNRRVLNSPLGSHKRSITVLVSQRCIHDQSGCTQLGTPKGQVSITLAEVVDGLSKDILKSCLAEDVKPCSYLRQKLYNIDDLTAIYHSHPKQSSYLSHSNKNHIRFVAKQILYWLLNTRVEAKKSLDGLAFKVSTEGTQSQESIRIAELLVREPGLMHENTGGDVGANPIYRRVEQADDREMLQDDETYDWNVTGMSIQHVLQCFPPVTSLLDDVRPRCKCYACRHDGGFEDCRSGCLRYTAINELFMLIAHALTDGFGGNDVSGISVTSSTLNGMFHVLDEIVELEMVRFETWFRLVCCVVTGCHWDQFACLSNDDGGSSLIAAQHGSIVVVAPWIDLRERVSVYGSFAANVFDGNMKGIPDDTAMVQTEQNDGTRQRTIPQDIREYNRSHLMSSPDTSLLVSQQAVYRVEVNVFRFMTIAKSGAQLRIVDPSTVTRNLALCKWPSCSHLCEPSEIQPVVLHSDILIALDFEQLLNLWDSSPSIIPTNQGSSVIILICGFLQEWTKFNIALAMSRAGAVIRSSKCCLQCAVECAQRYRLFCIIGLDEQVLFKSQGSGAMRHLLPSGVASI